MKERSSNIEGLRLLLMLSVVLLHIFGTHIKYSYEDKALFYPELLIASFSAMGGNAFIFISGYYGIVFRWRSFLKLIIQLCFYSISIYLSYVIFTKQAIEIKEAFKYLLPVSSGIWWFMSCYVALYLISPLINIGFEKLSKKQAGTIVLALLFFNNFSSFVFSNNALGAAGYNFFILLTVYCLASYMRIYKVSFKLPLLIYLISSLLIFILSIIHATYNDNYNDYMFLRHSDPLVLLSGVGLFYSFLKLKPRTNKFINKLGGYSLAVYLIHGHPLIYYKLLGYVENFSTSSENSLIIFLTLLGIGISIFLICLFIESIRSFLFRGVYRFIDKKIIS